MDPVPSRSVRFPNHSMRGVTAEEIRQLVAVIDYSEVLTITASEEDVRAACRAARNWRFRAVVAFPQYLGTLVVELKDSGVRAQIPVGFPCGGTTTRVKCFEAEEGLRRGATDLDMVIISPPSRPATTGGWPGTSPR